jgi:hypothetical protein
LAERLDEGSRGLTCQKADAGNFRRLLRGFDRRICQKVAAKEIFWS